jgi:hypothetical protein
MVPALQQLLDLLDPAICVPMKQAARFSPRVVNEGFVDNECAVVGQLHGLLEKLFLPAVLARSGDEPELVWDGGSISIHGVPLSAKSRQNETAISPQHHGYCPFCVA